MFCQPGYNFFANLLGRSNHNYLEIGVFNGDSIAGLANLHPNKTIFGIDPFIEDGCTTSHTGVNEDEFMHTQKENTSKNIAGLTNITLFELLSTEFNEILTDELINDMDVAWVLIDGSHRYEDVKNDYKMAMRLIGNKKGGVVFDDVNLEGVGRGYAEFCIDHAGQISQPIDLYADQHPGHIIAHLINHDN